MVELALLLSSYLFQNPQVGQRIEYQLTEPSQSYLWSREIWEVGKRVALRSEKLYPGKAQWEDRRYTYWTFDTLERTRDLLDHCEARGGTRETITVPAGSYATCRAVGEDNSYRTVTYWWGDVPVLGLVRRVIQLKDEDGSKQTVELAKIR